MSNFINDNSISVGYNCTGQQFFDILNKYRRYIHSFFFSVSYDMRGNKLDTDEVINQLIACNKFNIHANLLLNNKSDDEYIDQIEYVYYKLHLEAVTIYDITQCRIIKEKFPELEVHLSVRYFDYNPEEDCKILFKKHIKPLSQYIDVINISGARSYNDHELSELIHSCNMKTKFIINEGCVVNRYHTYKKLLGCENLSCNVGSKCHRDCDKVSILYPWIDLCRINIFKESLKFYDYDILKLSSRCIDNNSLIYLLDYWTSDEPTNQPILSKHLHENIETKYDTFLEWIKVRSMCSNGCSACKKCEEFYNKLYVN